MNTVSSREQDFLNAVLENAGALVVVLDHEGRIRRFNKACEKLSGYTFTEIEGKCPWETFLPPEDAETIRTQAFEALARNPQAMAGLYTNYWLSKNGARHLIEWSNTLLLDAGGKMEFMVCVGTDISARHRAEQQLLLKDAAIEHALNAIAMSDLEGRLTYVNPAFLRMWGYAGIGEVLGRMATEFWVLPEQAGAVIDALQQHGHWAGALDGRRADGQTLIAEMMAVTIRNAAGQPVQTLASFMDISARMRSEEKLRQNEAWLRHTQAIANVGSWEHDCATDLLKWSDETSRIFGRDPHRYGNNYSTFLDAVHPADRDAVDQSYRDAVDNRTPYEITHRIVCPDGAIRWVQERGETVYDEHGKALRTLGAVQDISERVRSEVALKESETNFRTLTESANVGILVGNPVRSLYANRRLLDMLGYSLEEFTRIGINEVVHPDEFEKVLQRFQARLSGQTAPSAYETVFVARDGRSVPVEITPTLTSWKGERAGLLFVQDITERRRLELAKRESEHWFQGIYNSIEEAILVVSPDRMLVSINPAAEKMFGYSPDEVKNQSTEIFHVNHERYLEFGARINDAFAKNITADFEYQARRKNGEIFPTEHSVSLLRNDAGEALGIVSVIRDITERKQRESLLNTSNQIVSAVLDTTPVLIAYLDTDMKFVRVNAAYAAADRKEPEHFVGKNHFVVYPNAENEAIFRRVAETGVPHVVKAKPFEYEHNPERGVTHWDWSLTPIKDCDGRVTGLVLSLLNVTDRIQALEAAQRSERELQALNESLEARVRERTAEVERQALLNKTYMSTTLDGFFLVETATGRIRDANPAFCAMLDYTQTELLRLSVPDIEANESLQDVAAHIEKLLAQGYDRFETRHRRKDGSLIDIEISASLVEIGGEKMIYVFAYDITPRKRAEAALIRARDEAERANKAKSEFLSRMSHELRTPMNAILGFAQVLRIEKLSPEQQEFVREIAEAGDHLLELINELLDLARIESGRLSATIEPVAFARIAEQAIRLVKPLLEQRQITLHNLCDPGIALLADSTRLRQVLVNLLSNAVKYNRQGGIIRIDCRPAGSGRLRIAVSDTGPGIAPEHLDKLFKPFERLGAERGSVEGTGIGLALSRRLTELMGGTMGLESAPGQGSTFWVELAQSETSPAVAAPTPTPAPPPDNAAGHRILYIEDNAANFKVVEAMFRHQPQLALLAATDGEYGLELARRYRPELILLDIHLPGMDGYAVLQELRNHPETCDIPVIALSADAMPIDIESGLKAGFRDYLTKPVRADVLLETLEKLLRH